MFQSWENNWDKLTSYFQYTASIKTGVFSDQAHRKKWTAPLHNWSLTVQQLVINFGERVPLDLKTMSNQ